jgi:antitoxin component YwqK of YwqJK toxin-antitoxin module
MKGIVSIIVFIFIYATSTGQQPKYTSKHFVAILDTNEFKITMPKKAGTGHTFVKIHPPVFDVDDDNTTSILFSQDLVVKIEGTISNGKRNGIFTSYIIDSLDHKKLYKIWEQDYKNDELNGEWRTYNLKGTLVHLENFRNSKQIGIERDYWIDGKTIMEEKEYFEDTTKTINRQYYANGNLKSEIVLIHNVPNGISKKFYENGILEDEVSLKDGKFEGVRTYYYPDGKKWIVEEYKQDMNWTIIANYDSKENKRNGGTLKNGNGTLIFYDDDITIRETLLFKDGKLQK